MKLEMEESDLKKIALMVAEQLKPMLSVPANGQADNRKDEYLDIKTLCDYLLVGERWVRGKVTNKLLPHYRVDGMIRFKKSEIDVYMRTGKA